MRPETGNSRFILEGKRILIGFVAVCSVLGAVLGYFYLPSEWHDFRRVLAGLLGGLGVGFIVVTTRLVGAYHEDEEDEK